MIKKFLKLVAIAIASVYMIGCGYVVNNYGASVENVESLRAVGSVAVSVGDFTSYKPGLKSIGCRAAGPVSTPNKESFEGYIKNALVSELKLAGIYSDNSSVQISAHLEKIDFNSNIGAGKWVFNLTVKGADSSSVGVNSTHEFSTNWVADKACQQVAQAFSPAVQKLIGDVIKNPEFKNLVKGSISTAKY